MTDKLRDALARLADDILGTGESVGLANAPGNDFPDAVFNIAIVAREVLAELAAQRERADVAELAASAEAQLFNIEHERVEALRLENAQLRNALEAIASVFPEDRDFFLAMRGVALTALTARAALAPESQKEKL